MDDSGISRASLAARAKAIITQPRAEWPRIAAEGGTVKGILTGYVMPLLAIPPLAAFLGGQIFGYGAFGMHYRPGFAASLSSAIVQYGLSLLGTFILMAVVDALAPRFDGTAGRLPAYKLVAYAYTAAALAGIFMLVPALGWLSILGLYSLYLFYTGVGPMMRVPEGKALAFTVVTAVATAVLALIASAIVGALVAALVPAPAEPDGTLTGSVTVPGVGTVDVGKLQAAAATAEARMQAGGGKPVEAGRLQALLPATVAGFPRTAVQSAGLGQAGSNAEGQYQRGEERFTLSVTDMSAMGALGAMGAALGVSSNREDADGYEKTATVDGHLVSESWNRRDRSGAYSTTVADRFMVKAEGSVGDIQVLKDAVATIDADKVADLTD